MRKTGVAVLTVAAFAAGSVATAATPAWKVFATASDNGEYATFASADSKVLSPKALALRTSGPVKEVSWFLNCEGETKASRAGISLVAVNTADTCTLNGSVIGGDGTVRVQLLRR